MTKKEQVNLKVRAVIDGQLTEQNHLALLSSNGTIDMLVYEEELADMGLVRNFITIQSDKVNMKRSGSIEMNQQFLKGRRTESVYQHPYGSMHLEIKTKVIERGHRSVRVHYESVMNGTEKQEHDLELVYMKENE